MKRHRMPAAIAAGLAAAALLTIAPAGAQAEPALDVTPTSGPVGTTIDVAGDDCATPLLQLLAPSGPDDLVPIAEHKPEGDANDSWTQKILVPAEFEGGPIQSGDILLVAATCLDGDEPLFDYESVEFLVTGDDPPTTPTTAPPSPTTPRPPTPIVDVPPFTG